MRSSVFLTLPVGTRVTTAKGYGTVIEQRGSSVKVRFHERCRCCGQDADFDRWLHRDEHRVRACG